MKKVNSLYYKFFSIICLLALSSGLNAQKPDIDSSINNLKYPVGFAVADWNSIPDYQKSGKGTQSIILITGLGFSSNDYKDLIKPLNKKYTVYTITLPGHSKSKSLPLPDSTVSYGKLNWTTSIENGIAELIKKENLNKPIIIGHFLVGTQVAIKLAAHFPDKVSAVAVLAGSAKFIAVMQGTLMNRPKEQMVEGVDKYFAPKWFKHMKKSFYDTGNFTPEVYSNDKKIAKNSWDEVVRLSMPVGVRYSCEYFATDLIDDAKFLKCPVLVLRPTFNEAFWKTCSSSDWLKPQFTTSWDLAAQENKLIQVKDIPNAAVFLWKDNFKETTLILNQFINSSFRTE